MGKNLILTKPYGGKLGEEDTRLTLKYGGELMSSFSHRCLQHRLEIYSHCSVNTSRRGRRFAKCDAVPNALPIC
jgi:hypothetical protein